MATTDTKLYVALGVLAVLGGTLYVTNRKDKEEAAHYSLSGRTADLPKIEIKDEDVNKITKITLNKPGGDAGAPLEVVLVKKGEEWRLEKPVNALANQASVKAMLDNLKTIKVVELIDPGKAEYGKYDLTDDRAFHAAFAKDDGTVFDAYFGENGGRGQMTRLAGKDGVFATKGYASYNYDRDVKGWREMSLFKFEEGDVTAITLDNENGTFEFKKDGEKWTSKYKKAKGGTAPVKDFDEAKVKDLIRAFKTLNGEDFADKSKSHADLGLDKPIAVLTFSLKDGATREVKFGANSAGNGRWVLTTGHDEVFSAASWAAEWATSRELKFQKSNEPKAEAPGDPGGMPGMPGGMPNPHAMNPHGGM